MSKSEGPSWLAAVPVMALRPRSTTSAKRRIKMVPAPGFYELGKWHPRVLQKVKPIMSAFPRKKLLDKFCLKHGFGNPFGTRLLWEKTQHTHEVINCICINIIEISNQVWSLISIPDASSQVLEDCMFLFAFRHANHLRGQSHQVLLQSSRCVYIYIYVRMYIYICYTQKIDSQYIAFYIHLASWLLPVSHWNLFHTLHLPACSKIVRQQFKQMRHPGFYRGKFGVTSLIGVSLPTPPSPLE